MHLTFGTSEVKWPTIIEYTDKLEMKSQQKHLDARIYRIITNEAHKNEENPSLKTRRKFVAHFYKTYSFFFVDH